MKILESKIITHVFVCATCTLEGNATPAKAGVGIEFRNKLKRMAAAKWNKSDVRISSSGCLGKCGKGINCVIYPEGQWISNLQAGDEHEVIKLIETIYLKRSAN